MLKRVKYQGVSLPIPMIEEIKKHIEGNSQIHGVPEFVRIAIREKLHKESKPVINREMLKDQLKKLQVLTGKKYEIIDHVDEGLQLVETLTNYMSSDEMIPVIDKKIKSVSPLVDKKLEKRVNNLESKVDQILNILKSKN